MDWRVLPRRTAVSLVASLAGAVLTGACGPIEYIANVPLEASGAVAEAKHVNGEKYAPYEVTAAQEYLHKSRELAGYARFHSSVEFARKASKLAFEAKRIAQDKANLPEEKNEENAPAAPPVQITPTSSGEGDHRDVDTVHTYKSETRK